MKRPKSGLPMTAGVAIGLHFAEAEGSSNEAETTAKRVKMIMGRITVLLLVQSLPWHRLHWQQAIRHFVQMAQKALQSPAMRQAKLKS